MKRYGKYIRPCWYAFILGPLLMLTEVAGEVLLPSFMADIINVGAANHDVGYILQKGMIMILTAFIMMAGGVGGAWFASVAAINFGTGLRKDAFKKIQTFSFSEIDRFSTGSLVTRLTNDITQVQNLIMMALRMMLRAPRHADRRDYYGVFDGSGAGGGISDRSAGYDSRDPFAFTHCISEI